MILKAKKQVCILTDNAINYFASLVKGSEYNNLKLSIKSGGCSGFKYDLNLTNEKPGKHDEVVIVDDITLIIDSIAIMHIIGTTIDFEKNLLFSGLTFDNPTANFKCGCGESFGI